MRPRRIQMTPRETLGIVNELAATTREENRPASVTIRSVTERLPNGRTTDKRVLHMEPEVPSSSGPPRRRSSPR